MINVNTQKSTGFLLINKPSGSPRETLAKWGPTSHDVIDQLRKITDERRIGHAGTLDPFASGLLIVAVGREATRQISKFSKMDKTYIAKIQFGKISNTYDRTGNVQFQIADFKLQIEDIEKTLKQFTGPQKQIPPMYSAKKIKGKKLYELARQGIEVERKPADIVIHYIRPLTFNVELSTLDIEAKVSSGTYIRSLAHDIGQALGCGAYLEELQRTEINGYKLEDAVETKSLSPDNWMRYLFL